ncbi:hypothetical protein RB595_009546 [Gaeumannomyces hyphopodioides]
MAEQCIVCLENLDTALSPTEDATSGDAAVGQSGGERSLIVGEPSSNRNGGSSTTAASTVLDPTPGSHHPNGDVAVINACGHCLHNSCLQAWAAKANSCPICRHSFHLVDVYDSVGGNLLKSYRVEDKKQVAEFDPQAWLNENPDDEDDEETTPCPVCNSDSDEDVLLLCDGCDASYHTYCIGLEDIPDGSWFCMECAPVLGDVEDTRPPRRSNNRRRNDFFPRTRATMRRARRRARSDEWQGAWGEITGRVFDALDIDLDSHDGDDGLWEYRRSRQLRERERREYENWQQRISIAARLGAQEVFTRNMPTALIAHVNTQQAVPTPETPEVQRAWATLDRAREHNGEGPSGHRKRKSRSLSASPTEPVAPEPERKLKRPRTRRIAVAGEASSSRPEGQGGRVVATADPASNGSGSASNARSPRPIEEAPSFLSSLLKEVEQSNPSDDEAIRSLFGDNRGPADASSPGSSPTPSAYSSPRANSLTPPPQLQARSTRPTSPTLSLSSHIEPIYPRANYLPHRPTAEASDSEARSPNQGASELRQPRPRRSQAVKLPRSPDSSPTRPQLPLEMKENISSLVRTALSPHWKSNKLTADQYSNINRDVSRKLYEEITDPSSVDEDSRQAWETKANQEVARAVSGLQA